MLENFSHVNEAKQIREEFRDEKFMSLDKSEVPWYADIMNTIVSGDYPSNLDLEVLELNDE